MPQPRVVLSGPQGQYEFRGGVAPGEYDVEVIRALNAAVSR